MSLLRRTRTEVAGAWRSVRYDLGKRPVEPPAGGPDLTSTGMNTFGPISVDFLDAPMPEPVPHRAPRRTTAVTAFGVLTVVGAAGAYLGIVNGLGSLLDETPAAANTFPPAASTTFTPNTGLGGGPTTRAVDSTTATAPATASLTAAGTTPSPARKMSPIRTTKPISTKCACPHPPVPTPTAPADPTPTTSPSETASSAGPSDSGSASPSPSETSGTPSNSPDASDTAQDQRTHRHG